MQRTVHDMHPKLVLPRATNPAARNTDILVLKTHSEGYEAKAKLLELHLSMAAFKSPMLV